MCVSHVTPAHSRRTGVTVSVSGELLWGFIPSATVCRLREHVCTWPCAETFKVTQQVRWDTSVTAGALRTGNCLSYSNRKEEIVWFSEGIYELLMTWHISIDSRSGLCLCGPHRPRLTCKECVLFPDLLPLPLQQFVVQTFGLKPLRSVQDRTHKRCNSLMQNQKTLWSFLDHKIINKKDVNTFNELFVVEYFFCVVLILLLQ